MSSLWYGREKPFFDLTVPRAAVRDRLAVLRIEHNLPKETRIRFQGKRRHRQVPVNPAEVLTYPSTHPRMRVAALAIRLRCRDCRHRTARIDHVARLPTQAFVAGMI